MELSRVIRLVSGWRGGFLYLSVWLRPPGPDLAALHPDWGSGRGIWDRRRRGETVSSQRLLQSLQEGAEAEGREARRLQVGLRWESRLGGAGRPGPRPCLLRLQASGLSTLNRPQLRAHLSLPLPPPRLSLFLSLLLCLGPYRLCPPALICALRCACYG